MISNQTINKKVKKSKKISIEKIVIKYPEELRDIILSIQGNKKELKNFNDKYDYSKITDMSGLFFNCNSLIEIPLLDTSKVTDMNSMFWDCENLKTIPQIDTPMVKDMGYMFYKCKSLKKIPLLNTVNVKNMSFMFCGCSKLKTIPELNTCSVKDMSFIFCNCVSLIDIPDLDILNVTNISSMFSGCLKLYETNNKISKFEEKVIEPKIDKTKLYSKTPSEFLTLYKEKHITLKELIDYCRDLSMGKIYPFILHIIMEKNYENMLNEKDMLAIIKEVGILSIKYIPDYLTFKYGDSYELMIKNMMEKHFENNEEFNNYKNKRVFS